MVENHSKNFIFLFLFFLLLLLASVPGGPVKRQHRTRGSGGSLWTSGVLLALCRRVGVKGQTPGGAASRGGVPAVCEIRQAGGAGVLGAVACKRKATTRGRQSGRLLQNRRIPPQLFQKSSGPYLPEILLCWLA